MYNLSKYLLLFLIAIFLGCNQKSDEKKSAAAPDNMVENEKLQKYVSVKLTADLSHLSDNQKKMIGLLIKVGEVMDEIFWKEAYGDKTDLISKIDDSWAKKYAKINYGPWDRLENNSPFIEGVGAKPSGANFYPTDITKEEYESTEFEGKSSPYTIVRRDNDNKLVAVPYHVVFEVEVKKAARLLEQAAELADNEEFANYLRLRAKALLTDEYYESDVAWINLKSNKIDMITGPIENYEDQFLGLKTAHTTYVLIKDLEWSQRLEKYASFLPALQASLPVKDVYKADVPGRSSQLAAYDVVYYAGDCNAGSKTIAVNLPNDEKIQQENGTRRSQLKNAMKAKYDNILIPIANELIAEDQRQKISFDAFFANTMFHEVAHGLGIKETINGKGTVRQALKELASALEEGKADILGLHMITQLHEQGELDQDLESFYVTFLASIFRSVRFGASSSHGKANMIRFNYFKELGAFEKDINTGMYRMNFEKMQTAITSLSEKILVLQGDGDYDGVVKFVEEYGTIQSALQSDLDKLSAIGIPVDITFEQGEAMLGL